MYKQQRPAGSVIEIIKYEDMDGETRKVFGNLPRTAGDYNFEVTAVGAPQKIEGFMKSLVYTKIEMIAIENIEAYRKEQKHRVLEMRRKIWYEQVEKIKQYIDHADVDQLRDLNSLKQFVPKKKRSRGPKERPFDPKRDFKIEIQPAGLLEPKRKFAFSCHVESAQSPIPVAQGQYNHHQYRYNADPPAILSAWIQVSGGDPDVTLLNNGNWADYSGNWEGVDETVYSEAGPGFWELKIYGYGLANYYKLTADWIP